MFCKPKEDKSKAPVSWNEETSVSGGFMQASWSFVHQWYQRSESSMGTCILTRVLEGIPMQKTQASGYQW